MVMPHLQRCPECGQKFMGSDCIGYPCLDCTQRFRMNAITDHALLLFKIDNPEDTWDEASEETRDAYRVKALGDPYG